MPRDPDTGERCEGCAPVERREFLKDGAQIDRDNDVILVRFQQGAFISGRATRGAEWEAAIVAV